MGPTGVMYTNVPEEVRGLAPLAPLVRLHPGGTWTEVQAQLDQLTGGKGVVFSLADLQYVPTSLGAVGRQNQLIQALRLMAALILTATCLNLSGLFIARIGSKRQELAVRLALGSSKWHMIRVFQRDVAALVFIGVPISLMTAYAVTRSLGQLSLPGGIAVDDLNLSVDWRVAAFGTVLAIIAVGAAAALPLYRALMTEPRDLLTGGVSGGDRKASLSRQWLVAVVRGPVGCLGRGSGVTCRARRNTSVWGSRSGRSRPRCDVNYALYRGVPTGHSGGSGARSG